MFSLSTFQSKGHSQNLFHLRNIQKDVIVNSNLARRIQKCCFREGRVGKLRYFNANIIFATIGQSGLQVRCKRQYSSSLGMNSLPQVKSYPLTPSSENEGGRAEEIRD